MRNQLRRILAVLALVATPAAAQDVPALQRRMDSLTAVADQARRAVEAFDDSVRRARPALDSVVVAPAVVAFEPELAALMRTAVTAVAESLSARFGALRDAPPTMRFVVRPYVPDQWERLRRVTPTVTVTETTLAGRELTSWRNQREPGMVAEALLMATTSGFLLHHARDAVTWMGGHAPTDSVTSSEWAEHRMLLVSSASSVGARCHAGDLVACRTALLLTPPVDPVMDWHDATSRRSLVLRARAAAERTDPRAVGECEAGSDSACVWVLQHVPPGVIEEPVHAVVRLGLARFAVAMGGRGALQRLAGSAPGLEHRIAAAANAPFDTVLSHWNRRIRDTRLPSHNVGAGIVMATVLWIGGLGALSLRSSRWR